MPGYYSERLAAGRLRRCYEIVPPRVQRYLNAEIEHVIARLRTTDAILELGCGYGRAMKALAPHAATLAGVDTSRASLQLAEQYLAGLTNCRLVAADAVALPFADHSFDVVVCIQNGISAFGCDQRALLAEGIRVTRPGGRVLCSSYAEQFWPHRLEWFRLQSEQGLLGEIDWDATGDGTIVCRDGFRATTIGPEDFVRLTSGLHAAVRIAEMDESSVFCEISP